MFLFESIYLQMGIAMGCFIAIFVFVVAKPRNALIPIIFDGILSLISVCAIMVGIVFALGIIQSSVGFMIGYVVCYSVLYIIKCTVKKSSRNIEKNTSYEEMTQNDIELNSLIQKLMENSEDESDKDDN